MKLSLGTKSLAIALSVVFSCANGSELNNQPPLSEASLPPLILEPGFQNSSSVEDIEPIVEWEKKQNADQRLEVFGDDFLGDAIDPHTGSLVFSHTDINIPGNSKLPVMLSRQRTAGFTYKDGVNAEFGDWTIAVPRITVTSLDARPWVGQRCSKRSNQILTGYSNRSSFMSARDYSNGITMEIPGQGSQQLLDDNNNPIWPASAAKVTKQNWYFTCISASDGGQGFRGHAPNGDKYYFNRAYALDAPKMGYIGANPLERNVYVLAATKVTDVNGNYVNYNYDSSNRLTSIAAKDGRRINLSYSGKLITRATAAGKTWSYSYRTNTYRRTEWMPFFPQSLRGKVLSRVTQPDGKYWTMNLDKMSATPAPSGRDYCQKWQNTISLKHPYGATGTFILKDTEHRHVYASQVRRYENCMSAEPEPPGGSFFLSAPENPSLADAPTIKNTPEVGTLNSTFMPLDNDVTTSTMAVIKKTVTGPSMTTAVWNYSYENDRGPSASSSSDRTNWTKVDAPDGHHTYYHAWVSEPLAGKLVKKETRSSASGSVLRRETYYYQHESSVGRSYVLTYPGPGDLETPVHTKKVVTTQSGDTYTSEYGYNTNHNSSSYSYSKPITESVKSNISTTARVTTNTFYHNKSKWILALPTKKVINGRNVQQNVYDSLGRKTSEQRNGAAFATYGYHSNGAFFWAKDANNRQTKAESYKRGTPQKVTRADNKSVYQYVDDFGRITSIKDPNGQTTSFSRDSMGRLLTANPPGSWYNTIHSYNFSGSPSQTITRGNAKTIITYDAMFRPVLIETRDVTRGQSNFINYDYDAAGRETFASFPSFSSTSGIGVSSKYDGLGRITEKKETISPYAKTTFSYHGSHRRTVKDAAGQQTHYYAYGYDGPDGQDVRAIRSPLGKNTDIRKNVWGELTSIRQWGNQNNYSVDQTRYYYYDSRRRLCRVRAKDVGDTVYQYDNSNWLIAFQKGLVNGSACATPSGNAKVTLTRDAIGRITKRNFTHSGTADISYVYDANGNLKNLNRGGANWQYTYNTLNLPVAERLSVDGRQYNISYGYDSAGNVRDITLPTGRKVNYNPDGLGRPRQAKWGSTYYANNVSYHAGGQVSRFNYGNGHLYQQLLNSRTLPSRILSTKGSTKAVDLNYTYDKRQLITSVVDHAHGGNNRSMTYDALEQITSASGPWGSGSFTYDSLGNIRKKDLGSRKVTINYDSRNRLSSSNDTGGVGGNTGYRSFAHDSRGNVSRAGGINFAYDYADQPISLSGSESGQYRYDGNLKRVKSTVGGKTIYNVYNLAGKLVHVDNATRGEKTDYISIGSMTVARVKNNTPTYLHHDNLGSAVAGTNASGSVIWRERYSPYGITLDNATANNDQAGYTGHIKDSDTGLVYMQARYYDPVIGRFYSNDPVDAVSHLSNEEGIKGFNRYSYAVNNPYKYTDPDGAAICGGACIAGIGYGLYRGYKVYKGYKKVRDARRKAAKGYGASIQAGITKQIANLTYQDAGHSGVANHKVPGGVVGAILYEAEFGSFSQNDAGQDIFHGKKGTDILKQLNGLAKRVNSKGSPLSAKQQKKFMKQIDALRKPLSEALKKFDRSNKTPKTGTRIRR